MTTLRNRHQRALNALPSMVIPLHSARGVQPLTVDVAAVESIAATVAAKRSLGQRSREVDPEVAPEVANALEEIHSNAKYTMETQSTECQNNAREGGEAVKNANGYGPAVQSFKEKMEAQRDKTKSEVNKKIDTWYAQATDLGEKHPEAQGAILTGMEGTIGTVLKALDLIGTALISIATNILNALEEIWNVVQQFFAPVAAIVSLF
jgi:hypothetical protein